MAIQGYPPDKCRGNVKGGGFCGEPAVLVFDSGDGMGACNKHIAQVCKAAMGQDTYTGELRWHATAVPADQWADYAKEHGL